MSTLVRRRPPLWAAILLLPLACNVFTALLVAVLPRRMEGGDFLLPMTECAVLMLLVADRYGLTGTRRTWAVFGMCVSFVMSILVVLAAASLVVDL